MFKIFRGK